MKTRGSEEITLREGLASKSTVKYSGFARFEKDLRGGRGEERRAASLRVWVGWGCVGWGGRGERVGPAQVEHRLCSAQELGAAHYRCVAPRP